MTIGNMIQLLQQIQSRFPDEIPVTCDYGSVAMTYDSDINQLDIHWSGEGDYCFIGEEEMEIGKSKDV